MTLSARSSEAMGLFNWSPLSSRRSYNKAKLVFLCLHSLVPSYFVPFTRFSKIHHHVNSQSIRLSLPKVKLDYVKNSFLFSGAKSFNELPANIANADNKQTFCRLAKHFFYHNIFITLLLALFVKIIVI